MLIAQEMSPETHLIVAYIVTLVCAVGTVGVVLALVSRKAVLPLVGPVTPLLGRKLMHIATGPVLCILWLAFPIELPIASRCLASTIPLSVTLYFLAVASDIIDHRIVVTTSTPAGWTLTCALYRCNSRLPYSYSPGMHFITCACLCRSCIHLVSRTGSASEIFRGPMWYGFIHTVACLLFWTDHPCGVISIIALCVGDGYDNPLS